MFIHANAAYADHTATMSPQDIQQAIAAAPSRPFCYVMYTSGSSGHPKAVCGTEEGTCLDKLLG